MKSMLYQKQMEELNHKINRHDAAFLRPLLQNYHISELQYKVLSYIKEHTACTIGMLAKALQQDAGNMSSLCKKLEQMNLLLRIRNAKDERIVNLSLSKQGSKCVDDIHTYIVNHYEKQWSQYNMKDKEIILQGLQKLNQFFETLSLKDGDLHE